MREAVFYSAHEMTVEIIDPFLALMEQRSSITVSAPSYQCKNMTLKEYLFFLKEKGYFFVSAVPSREEINPRIFMAAHLSENSRVHIELLVISPTFYDALDGILAYVEDIALTHGCSQITLRVNDAHRAIVSPIIKKGFTPLQEPLGSEDLYLRKLLSED